MAGDQLCRSTVLSRFSCLGAECEDTCCHGWSMQVDETTLSRYESQRPELLDAVMKDASGSFVMARDPETDFCVKLENGLCSIHKHFGSDFLTDACHFYPRVTRSLGEEKVMTVTLSCPETMRLALESDDAFSMETYKWQERLPGTLRDYLPEGLTPAQALDVHQAFLSMAVDKNATAERIMARVVSLAHSLSLLPVASWPEAVPFYLKMVDGRLPPPEPVASDPFNLLHALAGLAYSTKKRLSERLRLTIADMESALHVSLEGEQIRLVLTEGSLPASNAVAQQWETIYAENHQSELRRWLSGQLSLALFPFSGFGQTLKDRAVILAVRFATLRLALACACVEKGAAAERGQVVRIAQSIARVLDHLADPELSMQIYAEPGWTRESRLRAIVGDK